MANLGCNSASYQDLTACLCCCTRATEGAASCQRLSVSLQTLQRPALLVCSKHAVGYVLFPCKVICMPGMLILFRSYSCCSEGWPSHIVRGLFAHVDASVVYKSPTPRYLWDGITVLEVL